MTTSPELPSAPVGYLRTLADAEASDRSAQRAQAAAAWQRVVAQNPVNGHHWYRLGQARFAVSDFRGALPAYERAQQFGGWGGWHGRPEDLIFAGDIAYQVACCRAGLGDHDGAVTALAEALRLGFRDLDRPRTDELWAPLRADGAVRDLLGLIDTGLIDTGGLSRDEGWRADISFLAREVKRRAVAPFAGLAEPDFDAAVRQLAGAVPELSDAQLIAGLLRLLRTLGDGHAFVAPAEADRDLNRILPVKFYQFTEGLFVTAAAPEHRSLLGTQVLAVGGHPVDEVMAALEPLISRDNDQQVAWLGPEVLPWAPMLHALGLTPDPAAVPLTVRPPDGPASQVTVAAVAAPVPRLYPTVAPSAAPNRPGQPGWVSLADTRPGPLPLYLRHWDDLYWFEYLAAEHLVYFQLNGVGDAPSESLAAFCDRLFAFLAGHPDAALVIDLRWNGGGNTGLAQPLLHHLIACPATSRRGGLFVIIGRGTFSAAQNTATAIERETEAIFVGEPTGSQPNFIGETSPFELPWSKTVVNVSDLYWQTAWPLDDRPWIAPEIYVPPTFAAYRDNRDPALAAIMACVAAGLPA